MEVNRRGKKRQKHKEKEASLHGNRLFDNFHIDTFFTLFMFSILDSCCILLIIWIPSDDHTYLYSIRTELKFFKLRVFYCCLLRSKSLGYFLGKWMFDLCLGRYFMASLCLDGCGLRSFRNLWKITCRTFKVFFMFLVIFLCFEWCDILFPFFLVRLLLVEEIGWENKKIERENLGVEWGPKSSQGLYT